MSSRLSQNTNSNCQKVNSHIGPLSCRNLRSLRNSKELRSLNTSLSRTNHRNKHLSNKRSMTPNRGSYNFAKASEYANKMAKECKRSISRNHGELFGNIKGMVMYGQKKHRKFGKFSVNHLRKS